MLQLNKHFFVFIANAGPHTPLGGKHCFIRPVCCNLATAKRNTLKK